MGGDFTINILNLNQLSGGNYSSGLLELHFGRDGTTMNLGTGGADTSFGTLASALNGIKVLNVNSNINKYVKADDHEFNSAIALRAQYGFGDDRQVNQLWDILKGETTLLVGSDSTKTTLDENGNRVVTIGGIQSGMDISKLSIADQMLLGVVLGHEAYRDGVVTNDNYLETRAAVTAHTQMAIRMKDDEIYKNVLTNFLENAINAYNQGADFFNNYVDNTYDSSADYWKLTKEGNLEYDGFATLKDADGNILKSFSDMGLKSESQIEGALLWLLGVDKNDKVAVEAVRRMMASSGLQHSFSYNSDDWKWLGEQEVAIGSKGSFPITSIIDVTDANMGKTITINDISKLFSNIGASGNQTNTSINNIYGSAIGFLNYADAGGSTTIANAMLSNYYNPAQMKMIHENQIWLNNALKNGINIDGMMTGNARITQEFGKYSGLLTLSSSSVKDAMYFMENHTGIDAAGGNKILTPGGYWEITSTDGHKAYYQLYGSDVNLRIQHLNPADLSNIPKNTIYGNNNNTLLNFPTSSYGSGTGPHIPIDMTMNLPYNGVYERQFVNPRTLQPGSQLEYAYAYMDANKNPIQGRSGNFWRY